MRSLHRVLRAARSPGVCLRWLRRELVATLDPLTAPRRERRLDARALAGRCGAADVEELWERLAARPHPARTAAAAGAVPPGGAARVLEAAAAALAHRVDLLGSGPVELGPRIDWHRDFKSGRRWPRGHFLALQLVHEEDDSDVKVPWELSRFQWALPLGQAALLTGEPGYAESARDLLESWILENPCAHSVNWGVAMEPALRLLVWTWLFKVFARGPAWGDPGFRLRLLRALYQHGDFVERHLEETPVAGNHLTADATGLLVAGLFFGAGSAPARWARRGWRLLERELPRQALGDGVDFECAIGYHRFVLELFLLGALYRRACGLEVPLSYRERLVAMGRFAAAYTRPDGSAPPWGDDDGARALPFGGQPPEDHGYLAGLVGRALGAPELDSGQVSDEEVWWLLGDDAVPTSAQPRPAAASAAFPEGGAFVMRNGRDHVFVDCGPVGLAGRGGHGHNDCLGFEAVLDGTRLVVDSGTFVYTASLAERNRFRSTRAHNTPCLDGAEINRLDPRSPWTLAYDARPRLARWRAGIERDLFEGGHAGYLRLPSPAMVWRTLLLEHETHRLVVHDRFEGEGEHRFQVPLHLAPGVTARPSGEGELELWAGARVFHLAWFPVGPWTLDSTDARASSRYGVAEPVVRLEWSRSGPTDTPLTLLLAPRASAPADPAGWAAAALADEGAQ